MSGPVRFRFIVFMNVLSDTLSGSFLASSSFFLGRCLVFYELSGSYYGLQQHVGVVRIVCIGILHSSVRCILLGCASAEDSVDDALEDISEIPRQGNKWSSRLWY